VTLGGATPLTFSGTVNVSGTNTVTLANPAGTTVSGSLANAVATDTLNLVSGAANGTLVLSGSNSGFTGAFNLQSGNLAVGSNNALAPNTTLSGGTLLASTAITGLNTGYTTPLTINGPVTVRGNALT